MQSIAIAIAIHSTVEDLFGEPSHRFSRALALADGVLIDCSSTAQEAGIVLPVAITAAAWADCVGWSDADDQRKRGHTGQSESARLWDVCWMASMAIRAALRRGQDEAASLAFQLYRVPRDGRGIRPRLVTLLLLVGSGDTGEPVITILQPGED